MTLRVSWTIDVEADTPEEAARQALAIQRRPDSTATVFDVTDESGNTHRIDLDAIRSDKEPARVLILLDGGLVRDVLADRQGVEAAVLDMDTEGADVDDIVEVLGRKDRLLGTLQAHEVTVAPALVESAWRLAE